MKDVRGNRGAIIWGFALMLVFFGLFAGRVNLLFYGEYVYQVFSLYAHSAEIGQILCLFLIGILSYYRRGLVERSTPYIALVLLVSGYALTLYQATGGEVAPVLPVIAGALFGGGQGACFMCWIMVYSRIGLDDALRCMVTSSILSAGILLIIGFIPSPIGLFSALFAVVAGCVTLTFFCLYRVPLCGQDISEGLSVSREERNSDSVRSWLFAERRPLLCLVTVAFVCGAQRVVSLEGFLPQQAVHILFSVGYAVGAIVFWVSCRMFGSEKNFYGMYAALLVIMATCGVFLAIQDVDMQGVLYAINNIVFSIVSMCMVSATLRAFRNAWQSSLFFVGIICGTMYFAIQFGRMVFVLVSETVGMNATGILVVSVIIIYVIALVSISMGAFFRKAAGIEDAKGDSDEGAEGVSEHPMHQTIISIANVTEKQLRENPVYRQKYGLTDRELDMAMLLLAGCNSSDMAKILTISVNTVKTHLKNLYTKMNVHNRRELINLLNEIEGDGSKGSMPLECASRKGFETL